MKNDAVYKRIKERFEDGTFTSGVECPLTKYYFDDKDIFSFSWEQRTPEVCASLMDYSKCRLGDVPEGSRTREFFIAEFSNDQVNHYIKNHISAFDRQFFKDLIVTNKYSTYFDTNCFNVMPLEYIDDEMVSLAILHTTDWASDDWLLSVVERKKDAISEDVWKLAARLYSRMSGGRNKILEITPDEFKDEEYYKEMMRCNFNCGMSLDTNKGDIMSSIPKEVITPEFIVSLLNEDIKAVARFNADALEMEIPYNDNGRARYEKVWKAVVILDGHLIEYIPLNQERVDFFLSLYPKNSSEYTWGFKRVYKDWLRKQNAPEENERIERTEENNAKNIAEEFLMHSFLFAMEGEDPTKAIDIVSKANSANLDVMLPVRYHGVIPEKYQLTHDSEEYLEMIYKAYGIEIIHQEDSLFYRVRLPEGWVVTGERYHYTVVNDNNEEVINYFYCSKFYDMDAYVTDVKNPEDVLKKVL